MRIFSSALSIGAHRDNAIDVRLVNSDQATHPTSGMPGDHARMVSSSEAVISSHTIQPSQEQGIRNKLRRLNAPVIRQDAVADFEIPYNPLVIPQDLSDQTRRLYDEGNNFEQISHLINNSASRWSITPDEVRQHLEPQVIYGPPLWMARAVRRLLEANASRTEIAQHVNEGLKLNPPITPELVENYVSRHFEIDLEKKPMLPNNIDIPQEAEQHINALADAGISLETIAKILNNDSRYNFKIGGGRVQEYLLDRMNRMHAAGAS